jgi:hypothetical protein
MEHGDLIAPTHRGALLDWVYGVSHRRRVQWKKFRPDQVQISVMGSLANVSNEPMLMELDFPFFLNKTWYSDVKSPLSWCLVQFRSPSAMERIYGRSTRLAIGSIVRLLQLIET